MQKPSPDPAGWLSLFFGVAVAVGSFWALYALSPWATHYPWYQLDALVRHVVWVGPLFLLGWLAFIPSRNKRRLLLPAFVWTALFLAPFMLVLISELTPRPPRTGPDLEQVEPVEEKEGRPPSSPR
jgi:hypothetical protein